ncbi:MAG: beta-galactosidase [Chloroflexi bacterium]|nr:beta-galactosidase [Chloroflexota bacterium]
MRQYARHSIQYLAIIIRAAVLIGLVLVLSVPPARLVVIGPAQQVSTLNAKVGVHTRLTDEVEEWKIQRTLQMVREMGSPWIVEYFPWAYYEPSKGHYDWGHADTVVNHAVAQGLTVIARIDMVPQWARPEDTTDRYLDSEHYADYTDFIYAFVKHFRGRVNYIIIWNEPNLSFEWGYRQPDPQAYTELLRAAYTEAKRADADIQVLAAGLAPTLAPPGDEYGYDDLEYLSKMYAYGAGQYMDGLAVHAYGMTFPADDPADPEIVNFSRVELLYEIMSANGDGAKKIYITEGGWNDNARWTRAVKPYQRIAYTVQAYKQALTWDWCAAVCLWAFRFPWAQNTYADSYAFVTTSFIPKPIYEEVQHYTRGEPFEFLENTP